MNIIIVAGRTASGKTSVVDYLAKNMEYQKLVTSTTRDPRPGEENGVHYHFLEKEDFKQKIKEGFFLESVEAKGNFYGVGLNEFKVNFGKKTPILILDPMGVAEANKILSRMGHNVISLFIDESLDKCLERVVERMADDSEIKSRIKDLTNVEKDWDSYTRYTAKIPAGQTIEQNAETVVNLNKKFLKQSISKKYK